MRKSNTLNVLGRVISSPKQFARGWKQTQQDLAKIKDDLSLTKRELVETRLRLAEADDLRSERGALLSQRDVLTNERDTLLSQRDVLTNERDTLLSQRDRIAAEHYLGYPAPPAPLRLRVCGAGDLLLFIHIGQRIAEDILRVLPQDVRLTSQSRVLDFGCGCGRVIFFLRKSLPGQLFATDIDEEAIDWCLDNISNLATFSTNAVRPPIRFTDSFFDLIYSISIFTHLPEDMQTAWLEDLSRITKPGGYALLTVHGEELFPSSQLPKSEVDKFESTGFYYGGDTTDGLPEFYRGTVHSERYVLTRWREFFDIVGIIKRGLNNHQDIVVCRKR